MGHSQALFVYFRTRIVGVEGEHADHLTTNKAHKLPSIFIIIVQYSLIGQIRPLFPFIFFFSQIKKMLLTPVGFELRFLESLGRRLLIFVLVLASFFQSNDLLIFNFLNYYSLKF